MNALGGQILRVIFNAPPIVGAFVPASIGSNSIARGTSLASPLVDPSVLGLASILNRIRRAAPVCRPASPRSTTPRRTICP